MTVRQRALLERKGELQNEEIIKEELVALPTGTYCTTSYLLKWVQPCMSPMDCFRLQRNRDDGRAAEKESY
jgi:hypothetical protein